MKFFIMTDTRTIYPVLVFCFRISLGIFIPVESADAQGAHTPSPVVNVKAEIIRGPYLMDPGQTGMTVCFLTQRETEGKVIYWEEGKEDTKKTVVIQRHGLIPTGKIHNIRIEDLKPGTTYNYKVAARMVIKLRPYWPITGIWTPGKTYSFTTFSNNKDKTVHFSVITDTHENVGRIKQYMHSIDWDKTDFLVHDGDMFNYLNDEHQVFANGLEPINKALDHSKPLVYVRGNHDNRGPFAREFFKYVPVHGGRYYYTREDGPLHMLILNTGEDKPDTTGVYAGLNNFERMREEEYRWLQQHVSKDSSAVSKLPFRIMLMHEPDFFTEGTEDYKEKWTDLANKAHINLLIAGHWHRYGFFKPGEFHGNNYYVLVVSNHQVANVTVTDKLISVKIINDKGQLVHSFEIDTKGNLLNFKNYKNSDLKRSKV